MLFDCPTLLVMQPSVVLTDVNLAVITATNDDANHKTVAPF
jgi:hypothetical protein